MITLPVINMKATGMNIKKLRIKNGYSVEEVQQALHLATKQAVYKWQQGVTLPDISNLLALARLFRVEISDILVCSTPAVITPFPARPAA